MKNKYDILKEVMATMKIDGNRPAFEWEIESAFIKGDSVIILSTKNPTKFRLGLKLYHVNDTISGSYWAAFPIASCYDEATDDWYPYEGGGIIVDDGPPTTAWGNNEMDQLDWLIFNCMS